MKWQRISPFESKNIQSETWICEDTNYQKKYNVEVTLGKDIDILALKGDSIENIIKKVASTRNSRISVFQNKDNLERVWFCPICKNSSDASKEILNIYGASYCQCSNCLHYYLVYRPTEKYLKRFYKTDIQYQNTY